MHADLTKKVTFYQNPCLNKNNKNQFVSFLEIDLPSDPMQKMSEAMNTVITTRNLFARATRRSTLKSNQKKEDKENNYPVRTLKSNIKNAVETKKRQKHIKNAIRKHGQAISHEEDVEKPEEITQKKYVNFGHLLT